MNLVIESLPVRNPFGADLQNRIQDKDTDDRCNQGVVESVDTGARQDRGDGFDDDQEESDSFPFQQHRESCDSYGRSQQEKDIQHQVKGLPFIQRDVLEEKDDAGDQHHASAGQAEDQPE